MRKVTDTPWPHSKEFEDYVERLQRGEVKPRWPDAEPPVFITEEMEAEALARGDTKYSEPPMCMALLEARAKEEADKKKE